jgi:hypothetical protein
MCKKNFQFELRIWRLFLKEAAAIGVALPIMVLVSHHHIILSHLVVLVGLGVKSDDFHLTQI